MIWVDASFEDINKMGYDEVTLFIAENGETVDKIKHDGIYFHESLLKIMYIVKNGEKQDLKFAEQFKFRTSYAQHALLSDRAKWQELKIAAIADSTKFTFAQVFKIIRQTPGIHKEIIDNKTFYLPTLKETSQLIHVLKKYPRSFSKVLYNFGLDEGIEILDSYMPIEDLKIKTDLNEKEFNEILELFRYKKMGFYRMIHIDDYAEAYKMMKEKEQRKR
jgi:hypothetical protein